jgi:hypothetical protein
MIVKSGGIVGGGGTIYTILVSILACVFHYSLIQNKNTIATNYR